jgi:hypothetical protein
MSHEIKILRDAFLYAKENLPPGWDVLCRITHGEIQVSMIDPKVFVYGIAPVPKGADVVHRIVTCVNRARKNEALDYDSDVKTEEDL